MVINNEITLDISKQTQFVKISLPQGDAIDRVFKINLVNGVDEYVIPTTATVRFEMTRPNGSFIYNNCPVENNQAILEITPAISAEDGRFPAQFKITDSSTGGLIKSFRFHILIHESVNIESAVVNTSEFTALQDMELRVGDITPAIQAAETATDNANNAADSANDIADQLEVETLIIWKPYVSTYVNIATTYPIPELGWTTQAQDTGIRWRYNGTEWINIGVVSDDKVGDLSTVTTTNKINVVGAINELDSQLADIAILATKFGAKADGSIVTTLIQNAIDYASLNGYTLWLPKGTFVVGSLEIKCNVDGDGTFKLLPNTSVSVPIGFNGITIKNITIDGDVQSTGDGVDDYIGSLGIVVLSDDVTLFNVKTKNTFGAGIRSTNTKNLKIILCDVRKTRGNFSDGIYLRSCIDAKVLFNKVEDITRIGIVSEGTNEAKSYNPLVQGNTVFNAHTAGSQNGGSELNGGIWLENTLGGKVLHNNIKQTNLRGIIVNPIINDGKHYHYLVDGNTITDAEIGIALVQGSDSDKVLSKIDILNNSILGNYNIGINTGNRSNVTIDNCYFGSATGVRGLIVTYQFTYPVNLTISNCSKGVIEYVENGVDIEFYNTGMLNVIIENLIGIWSYSAPVSQITGTFKAYKTTFLFNRAVASYLCNFLNGGVFDSCDFIFNTSNSIHVNTPIIKFINCTFKSYDNNIRTLTFSYEAFDNQFKGCDFNRVIINDITQDANGNFKFLFKDTVFNEYGADGAIKTAYYETRLSNKWKILECSFYDSGANIPIKKSRFDVTQLIARNNISPTASIAGAGLTMTSEVNTLVVL